MQAAVRIQGAGDGDGDGDGSRWFGWVRAWLVGCTVAPGKKGEKGWMFWLGSVRAGVLSFRCCFLLLLIFFLGETQSSR